MELDLVRRILLAADLLGRVVGVSDGDTITVLDTNHFDHRIRLAGIDAPEKSQPLGERAKQSLWRADYGRDVRVEWDRRDRYGRACGQSLGGATGRPL
jgi:endonuclease YncB( thermonuclease family)